MVNNWGYLGIKIGAELYECGDISDDLELIRYEMVYAADLANMNVVGKNFHKFFPQGLSGHLTLAESHMDVSTWPEHRFAEIDIRSCGDNAGPDRAMMHLINIFRPSEGLVERRYTGVFDRKRTPSGLYLPPSEHPRTVIYPLNDYIDFVESSRVEKSRL